MFIDYLQQIPLESGGNMAHEVGKITRQIRAIAQTHHHNFSEYGCRVVQLTVQEIELLGFIGFSRPPNYPPN
ncbi:MAG: hypothetical protein RMX65_030425 [Nostoc sp. DedQUE01]